MLTARLGHRGLSLGATRRFQLLGAAQTFRVGQRGIVSLTTSRRACPALKFCSNKCTFFSTQPSNTTDENEKEESNSDQKNDQMDKEPKTWSSVLDDIRFLLNPALKAVPSRNYFTTKLKPYLAKRIEQAPFAYDHDFWWVMRAFGAAVGLGAGILSWDDREGGYKQTVWESFLELAATAVFFAGAGAIILPVSSAACVIFWRELALGMMAGGVFSVVRRKASNWKRSY